MMSGGVGGKWEEEEEDEGGERDGGFGEEMEGGERWREVECVSNFLFLKVGPKSTKIILIKYPRVF